MTDAEELHAMKEMMERFAGSSNLERYEFVKGWWARRNYERRTAATRGLRLMDCQHQPGCASVEQCAGRDQ